MGKRFVVGRQGHVVLQQLLATDKCHLSAALHVITRSVYSVSRVTSLDNRGWSLPVATVCDAHARGVWETARLSPSSFLQCLTPLRANCVKSQRPTGNLVFRGVLPLALERVTIGVTCSQPRRQFCSPASWRINITRVEQNSMNSCSVGSFLHNNSCGNCCGSFCDVCQFRSV